MKKVKSLLTLLVIVLFFFAVSPVNAQPNSLQTFQTTKESVIGFLQYLPKDYASNSSKYPVVIFLHGIGERGANSTTYSTLLSSIASIDNLGPPKFARNGTQFPFILISPQLKNNYGNWPVSYVQEVIDYVKTYLRVDEKKIHITGLSLGGGGAWTMAQDFAKTFASVAPVCGAYNSTSKAGVIGNEDVPVWAFHGDADPTVNLSKSVNMVNSINTYSPSPRALMTIYPGIKHNAWDRAYLPDHTYHNPNIYEWMMKYTNSKNGGNYIPTASAGSDITSTSSSITLSGSGSDSDGSISSYRWTKISGPSASISSASSKSTSVSGLKAGTYYFRLRVIDNSGNADSDYVKVTIGSSSKPANVAPVANAGSDKTIKAPQHHVSLYGSGKDSDGTIASYSWAKVSGGTAKLSGTSSAKLSLDNLTVGTYVFRLTVKDNAGSSNYNDAKVIVK
jgi:poly(3-hydroxybutyrate) depolymerase